MDVTLGFNDYLAAKGAKQILQEPFQVSKLNGFMRDAYRIVRGHYSASPVCAADSPPRTPSSTTLSATCA
jgi:hypothetical protein